MAISYIGAVGASYSATTSPVVDVSTIDGGGAPDADDILILVVQSATVHNTAASVASFSEQHEIDGAGESLSILWKRATGSEGSITFTSLFASNESGRAVILCYRGVVDTGNPFSVVTSNTGSAGPATAHDTNSVTPADSNCLALGIMGCDPSGNTTFAWDGGITERVDGGASGVGQAGNTDGAIFVGEKQLSGTPATTLGGDADASVTMQHAIVFLIPADTGTTLEPAGLSRTRAQGTPVVSPQLLPAGLSRSRAQGTPVVSPQVLPSGLARSRALGDPTVTTGTTLLPSGLDRSRAQGTPVVSPQILPAALARSRAQGSPTVSTGTTGLPPALERTRAQGTPTLSPQLLPAALVRTRVQGDHLVSVPGAGGGLERMKVGVGT